MSSLANRPPLAVSAPPPWRGRLTTVIRERSRRQRYGMAVLAAVLALLARLPLEPLLGESAPFLLFFPAIMVASWFGGVGPGLAATVLSLLATLTFILPPLGVPLPADAGQAISALLFCGVGMFISGLSEALHRSRRRAEAAVREQERLTGAAERARTEAEEANRVKDEFLATLSHELRTPLNAVLGWAQILRLKPPSEGDLERGLEAIARNARVQAQLVEELLDASRIVTGQMRMDVRPIDLVPVVDAAIESIRPAAEAKEIRLQRVVDPLGPVAGDPARLQQVMWNLLSNAVKFTPKGGQIQVQVARRGSHVEIAVGDTGAGIDPEFLPHVFERFRQSDSSSRRRHGGLGLGLAIVRHLVELHGGTVRAESAGPGQGATFVVRLPVALVAPA
jgi:signal transduction histidine kinase